MRFMRIRQPGRIVPAVLDDDDIVRDLSSRAWDIDARALAEGTLERLSATDIAALPALTGPHDLAPAVGGIGKILCIGWNYRAHAAEIGGQVPDEPLLFTKAITALAGPDDPIVLPRGSTRTDWEAELAVIIGRTARSVTEDQALDHVAGYAVINDVSERHFQKERGGQFVKGKSADSFAPLGPWLIRRDAVPDPQDLHVWLDLNGERQQDGGTAQMIFPVRFLVSYLSQFMTLAPGDVIATGTPPGVGAGKTPPRFLRPGDQVRLGIDGLGTQTHAVQADAGR